MGKQEAVEGESATQKEDFDFDTEANKILEEISGEEPVKTKEEVKKEETTESKKEDPKKEEPKKEEVDELKIPRSRLNKEIEKRKSVEKKLSKIQTKFEAEQKRLNSLSDDEKEEQQNLAKLGMDTKLSKLEDMLDDLKEDLSEKDKIINSLKGTIQKSETAGLGKRISELTKKYDGNDGLPKFDIKELLEFSKQKNFLPEDPLELYNFKYQAEIYAKKYEKAGFEVDKGNKENFEPKKRNPSFKDGDEDFMDEAMDIINSIGKTT